MPRMVGPSTSESNARTLPHQVICPHTVSKIGNSTSATSKMLSSLLLNSELNDQAHFFTFAHKN
jgi:hypothetical protein